MIDSALPARTDPAPTYRVGLISTFPPTRCGIARFSSSLADTLGEVAPDLSLDIVRLIDGRPPTSALSQVGMEIDPNNPVSARAAARHLNQSDVVVIQHEYGIFGANDGEAVLDMVELINRPLITVVHTVVDSPNERQRKIIDRLHQRSRLVVLSESARSALAASHSIPRSQVVVIPHGSRWTAQPPRVTPARELITWGLLGPGKGLELSIRAMTLLRDLEPRPRYRIVGRTHPAVARAQGFAYRRSVESLVRELGVADMIDFVDRYLEEDELFDLVTKSHVVVIPYDNSNQVTSGVMTDAVAAGRPVVATRFPHAVELLDPGPGVVVEHDSGAIAQGLRALLESPGAYDRAAQAASAKSPDLSWEAGAIRYAELIRSLISQRATADI